MQRLALSTKLAGIDRLPLLHNFFVGQSVFFDAAKDVFDSSDGANLANVSVALCQGDVRDEDRGPAATSPLTAVKVSRDLSVAVILSSSSCGISVDLNMYFRYVCSRIPK